MNKIIITGPYSKNGGVAQFIQNLIPFFGDQVVLFKRGKRGFKVFHAFWPLLDIVSFVFRVIIESPKKVIINSSLSNVGIFRDGIFVIVSKLLGIRTILFIHGFDEKVLNKKYIIRFGYFRADKIFVLYSDFKSKLEGLGYDKEIKVTYNPINRELINYDSKGRIDVSIKEKLIVLMMSRLVKSKGVYIGLDAFKFLKEYDVELHIAGIGEELENAKEFVKLEKIENIIFHGFVSGKKKEHLLNNADILLFPSYHNEGLPINILESLAMGIYVISRPIAGILDLRNDYHLKLIDSLAPEDFATSIIEILKSGMPLREIKINLLKAKIDFSPKGIYEKVVLFS